LSGPRNSCKTKIWERQYPPYRKSEAGPLPESIRCLIFGARPSSRQELTPGLPLSSIRSHPAPRQFVGLSRRRSSMRLFPILPARPASWIRANAGGQPRSSPAQRARRPQVSSCRRHRPRARARAYWSRKSYLGSGLLKGPADDRLRQVYHVVDWIVLLNRNCQAVVSPNCHRFVETDRGRLIVRDGRRRI
jgi:hypothetical protein